MSASPTPEGGDPDALPERVVFYDGVCGLCDRSVQFLLQRDRRGRLHYAPLQGDTAARLRASRADFPSGLDTMAYLRQGELFVRAAAWFELARELPAPWRALGWLRWVPGWFTDPVYACVARLRYRVFGRSESCRVPSGDERQRFLP